MSTVTTSRPPVPAPAPAGQHWVPEEVPADQLRAAGPDDTCRYRGSRDPEACGEAAVVQKRHGVTRITWWNLCQEHAARTLLRDGSGLWAEDGKILCWKLEPLP